MLKKGFTLIELLIVIVIIGILAGIVVGIVGVSATQKAQDAKLKANVHEVQNALEQYYVDKTAYPAALVDLTTATPKYLNSTDTYAGLTYNVNGTTGGYELSFKLNNQNETVDNTTIKLDSNQKKIYFVTSKQL